MAAARAAELEETAQRETDALRAETEKYIEEKLANFELTLERTLDVVRRGRARISQGVVHGLGDDSDVDDMELPDHLERGSGTAPRHPRFGRWLDWAGRLPQVLHAPRRK